MQVYMHDFAHSLVSFLYSAVWTKTTKHTITLDVYLITECVC